MPLLKQKPNEKDQQQKSDLKINMNSTGVDGGGPFTVDLNKI